MRRRWRPAVGAAGDERDARGHGGAAFCAGTAPFQHALGRSWRWSWSWRPRVLQPMSSTVTSTGMELPVALAIERDARGHGGAAGRLAACSGTAVCQCTLGWSWRPVRWSCKWSAAGGAL